MFNFRIITTEDGIQIIDHNLVTDSDSLTLEEFSEYAKFDEQQAMAEKRMRRKRRIARRRKEHERSILWKLACFCGLV